MGYLIFVGILSCITGILYLFFPETVRNLNNKANRVVFQFDAKLFNLRIGVGVSLLLISVMTLFVAFYLNEVNGPFAW
ncbi:MAG: hypothetical protein PHV17_08910 [Candidatus Omnitrophica bacterium]|nr:hypothetical protein [Candidatus Omnitrophota bacterium]